MIKPFLLIDMAYFSVEFEDGEYAVQLLGKRVAAKTIGGLIKAVQNMGLNCSGPFEITIRKI